MCWTVSCEGCPSVPSNYPGCPNATVPSRDFVSYLTREDAEKAKVCTLQEVYEEKESCEELYIRELMRRL